MISLLLPQLPSSNWVRDIGQTIIPQQSENVESLNYKDTFEKLVFGTFPEQAAIGNNEARSILPVQIIFMVYLSGLGLMLFRFISNLVKIKRLVNRNEHSSYGKFTIVSLPTNYATFSFFRFIFFNQASLGESEKQSILLHEETHIKQGHSFDLIFIEICKILFWFNPVIWLYGKSICVVHECLADNSIVEREGANILDYQSLLLEQYINRSSVELAHPFNFSLIKLRIKMMDKSRSKWWAKFKLVFAIPVILLSSLAFSNAEVTIPTEKTSEIHIAQKKFQEPFPWGCLFVPSGSFVLNRSDGNKTVSMDISIDAFWMRETEVTVTEYMEYVESLENGVSKQAYEEAQADKSKAPFEGYYTSKEYEKYPMVGVTVKQAEEYCLWVTKKENEKLAKKGKAPVYNYRLPSEMEWVYASFGGRNPEDLDIPAITELNKTQKGDFNDWGIANMLDNVSEWTSSSFDTEKYMTELPSHSGTNLDQVIVKGNNYKNSLPGDMLVLNGNQSYDFVGFRYVRTYMGDQYGKTK